MTNKHCKRHGRNRSIVRWLGSYIPLKPAPRIVFHGLSSNTNDAILTSSDNKLHAYSSGFNSSVKPDLLEFGHLEQKKNEDNLMTHKLDNLEKELQELRQQMASIISAQLKEELQKVAVTPVVKSSIALKPGGPPPLPPPPPPPLPPPPPPFPTASALSKSTRTIDNTPKRPQSSKAHLKGSFPMDMGEVLKDLNKVKLRRIDRSPGGTPVRKPQQRNPTDPDTALMHVLKRRFAAMHVKSPGTNTNCDFDDSLSDTSNPLVIC